MKKSKILIVEDEVLIAHTISSFLGSKDFETVGVAMNFDQAIDLLNSKSPDLALLDIRLNGKKTGIDVAHYINEKFQIPFIYLTSQFDSAALQGAKSTFPAGYLNKPMHKETLYSTIEIALFNHQQLQEKQQVAQSITLAEGSEKHKVSVDNIKFVQSEHIYVKVYLDKPKSFLLVRKPLKAMKELLPKELFIQPSRGCLINTKFISSWDKNNIYIEDAQISISRNNKEAIFNLLNNL